MEVNNTNQNYANLNLYPTAEIQTNEKTENKQNSNNFMFNNSKIIEFIKLFSLLKNKKMDFKSVLSSTLGKNFASNEELSTILSLFSNKQTKNTSKETLPKIDSLERINWKIIVYKV